MRLSSIIISILTTYISIAKAHPSEAQRPVTQAPAPDRKTSEWISNISIQLFAELEEFARIVDISYCVGTSGIWKPFECASRCDEFPGFELVDTFNTGPLMSDSCGYIVLDHEKKKIGKGRIIVAFRGTYSLANTIVDLSTIPQEYLPYPGSPDNSSDPHDLPKQKHHRHSFLDLVPKPSWFWKSKSKETAVDKPEAKCTNCTVHTGFWTSWQNTRSFIIGHLEYLLEKHPDYRIDLVGHSLGGAVAALAGLEFDALGWKPTVTTFGEPRVGNLGLRNYIDGIFQLPRGNASAHGKTAKSESRYRRVTHVDDPVPLLPLQEWGYRAHAGEVYISKPALQPTLSDIRLCYGDDDVNCIAGAEVGESWFEDYANEAELYDPIQYDPEIRTQEDLVQVQKRWGIPARYKMWQLFFAHRDYFWRLGLCVPGGDPFDWGRHRYDFADGENEGVKDDL